MGAELYSHESDLYVRETPEVLAFVVGSGCSWSRFRNAVTGEGWLDLPCAFYPWWQARQRTGGAL